MFRAPRGGFQIAIVRSVSIIDLEPLVGAEDEYNERDCENSEDGA